MKIKLIVDYDESEKEYHNDVTLEVDLSSDTTSTELLRVYACFLDSLTYSTTDLREYIEDKGD